MKTQRKKIAILLKSEVRSIDVTYTAGTERVFLRDAVMLREQGWDVRACTAGSIRWNGEEQFSHKKIPYPHALLDFLKFHHEHQKNPHIKWVMTRIYYWLYRFFELYYAFTFVLLNPGRVYYCHQAPLAAIFSPHKTLVLFHQTAPCIPFSTSLAKRYKKSAFLFVSGFLLQNFRQNFSHIYNPGWRVLHNSVDETVFHPKNISVSPPASPVRFGFLSTWNKEKGTLLLCRALELANKNPVMRRAAVFYLFGSADLWSIDPYELSRLNKVRVKLKHLSRKYPNIVLMGKTPYSLLPFVYSNLHYTLLPSIIQEGFPNVVVESMAMGIPIITFHQKSIHDLIHPGVTGYLMGIPNPKKLADGIEKLTLSYDPKSYKFVKNQAQRLIFHKHSESKRIYMLNTILSELTNYTRSYFNVTNILLYSPLRLTFNYCKNISSFLLSHTSTALYHKFELKHDELRYWDDYFYRWKNFKLPSYRQIVSPKRLSRFITNINLKQGDRVKIVEIGSGPISHLAWIASHLPVTITAIDPLAVSYMKLYRKYKFTWPVIPVKGYAENISAIYPPEYFDVVYSSNSLDHVVYPQKCVRALYTILKTNGIMYFEAYAREATILKWRGLHRYDIFIRNNSIYCLDKSGKLSNLMENLAVRCIYKNKCKAYTRFGRLLPDGNDWDFFSIAFRKLK